MSLVILDLEWNTAYCKKLGKYVNEIIEFGAIKLSSELNTVDMFYSLVKPTVAKEIHPQVKKLITVDFDELLKAEKTFPYVLDDFADFLGDSTLITWSTADLHTLMDNCRLHFMDVRLPFMKSYCDLQKYCEYSLGVGSPKRRLGLSACAQLLDIPEGAEQAHRALDDALLSFKCLKALYKQSTFEEFVEPCDDEFFVKLKFKNKFITSINHPKIDRQQIFFDCPDCKVRCVRKSRWSKVNNSMDAFFVCPECKNSFRGRVQAKLKYEGVVISKRILDNKQ